MPSLTAHIPSPPDTNSRDYQRVAAALAYMQQHTLQQPSLAELAQHSGLSEGHFQRLFQRWVGISPKRFLQHLTLTAAKAQLRASASLLDTAFANGLSGSSRLHDLFVTYEALTPGEYKSRGEGLEITYGFGSSPFGDCFLQTTARGICDLSFVQGDRQHCLDTAKARCPGAKFMAASAAHTEAQLASIFQPYSELKRPTELRLLVRGSRFQIKVWEALLAIPPGHLVSYGQLAKQLQPDQQQLGLLARAVGHAVGENPIAWLIPCHRVIRQNGGFGQYHWGSERKLAMIGWEAAQNDIQQHIS